MADTDVNDDGARMACRAACRLGLRRRCHAPKSAPMLLGRVHGAEDGHVATPTAVATANQVVGSVHVACCLFVSPPRRIYEVLISTLSPAKEVCYKGCVREIWRQKGRIRDQRPTPLCKGASRAVEWDAPPRHKETLKEPSLEALAHHGLRGWSCYVPISAPYFKACPADVALDPGRLGSSAW